MRWELPEEGMVVGVLSGTSADGADVALVRVRGRGRGAQIHLCGFETYPLPAGLRAVLFELLEGGSTSVGCIAQLHRDLGSFFGASVLALLESAGVRAGEVLLVGSHGQTVYHEPPPGRGTTLQLGSPAHIAQTARIRCVSDFRSADMAQGGQGAPLVPYYDWVTATDHELNRCVVNIGGIANLTYLPAGAGRDQVMALDTGPGNMVIDAVVRRITSGQDRCDWNGKRALAGEVREAELEGLLTHPFLRRAAPRSAGRREFGPGFVQTLYRDDSSTPWAGMARRLGEEDLVATLTRWTAESIARSCTRIGPVDQVVVGGGGAKNPAIMSQLRDLLAPAELLPFEALGECGGAREAAAFAFLAWEFAAGNPANLPRVTGAGRPVVLGSLTPGPEPLH